MAQNLNHLHNILDAYMHLLLNREEYKNANVLSIYKNGIFKTKVKSITSLTLLHYLLKILAPGKMTRVLWPLYNVKMEAEFRKIALDILCEIFKNKSHMPKINMSMLITGYGVKIVQILVNVAAEIIQQDICAKENFAKDLDELKKKRLQGEVDSGVKAMQEAVDNHDKKKEENQQVLLQCAQERKTQLMLDIKHVKDLECKIEEEAEKIMAKIQCCKSFDGDVEFQNEIQEKNSNLNAVAEKIHSYLIKAVACDQMSNTTLQEIHRGETNVNLVATVEQAVEFTNLNPTISSITGSEEKVCVNLIKDYNQLAFEFIDELNTKISALEAEVSKNRDQFEAITQRLSQRINFQPTLVKPNLSTIFDPNWSNSRNKQSVDHKCDDPLPTLNVFEQFSSQLESLLNKSVSDHDNTSSTGSYLPCSSIVTECGLNKSVSDQDNASSIGSPLACSSSNVTSKE